jgi:hypothetical protein
MDLFTSYSYIYSTRTYIPLFIQKGSVLSRPKLIHPIPFKDGMNQLISVKIGVESVA